MDSGRPEGTSRLIGVRAIESPHGDFDCWLPNSGSRLKGVGLYLSNDMSLTLKYIYICKSLSQLKLKTIGTLNRTIRRWELVVK